MSTLTLWLTIVGAGAVTFALRLSFIALMGRMEMPRLLGRALRFVPAAVMTAVVIPLLFYRNGALEASLGNERLIAGLVAALIAWRTRSVLFTLGGGMVVLWTLQFIERAFDGCTTRTSAAVTSSPWRPPGRPLAGTTLASRRAGAPATTAR